MQPFTLINGSATRTLASTDRGFHFGQGVSTRIKVVGGRAQLWHTHMDILQRGCSALGFPIQGVEKLVKRDLGLLPKADLTLCITLTAGLGSRELNAPNQIQPTRILQVQPCTHLQAEVEQARVSGVELTLCETRMAIQPRLAGIKQLNRMEQVLARAEWSDPTLFDGVLCDTEGFVVGATRANLFWVKQGVLFTPDLRCAGIRGAMRSAIMRLCSDLGITVVEVRASVAEVAQADELFLSSAADGILPVKAWLQKQYPVEDSGLTAKLQSALIQVLYD